MKPESKSSNPVKTRFAPSPTGLMHIGNVRVALFNYLFAHHAKGTMLLRVEDTDVDRSELHFREAIFEDLKWLGLNWDEGPFYQSERQAIYNEYYTKLEEKGLIYPCFCTEETLALTRKIQLSAGQPPRYPGTCHNLKPAEVEAKKAKGLAFTLRFRMPKSQKIAFNDLIKGPQSFDSDHIGDFIIRRGDNSAPFMFSNPIDDALMGVTHALRGDDHLTNTPRQLLILEALNLTPPQYGHFSTILGADGRRLSKRNGSRSIRELRETGFLPEALCNYLARLGVSDIDPRGAGAGSAPASAPVPGQTATNLLSLISLAERFEVSNISHGPAHYDEHQLNHWQGLSMHHCSSTRCWELIAPFVSDFVPEEKRDPFVKTVQPNLLLPKESEKWAQALFGDLIQYSDEALNLIRKSDPEFFIKAADQFKNQNLSYKEVMQLVSQETHCKGKALFLPIRAALTGEVYGPELEGVLALMGRDKARHRLLEATHHATGL